VLYRSPSRSRWKNINDLVLRRNILNNDIVYNDSSKKLKQEKTDAFLDDTFCNLQLLWQHLGVLAKTADNDADRIQWPLLCACTSLYILLYIFVHSIPS
jgi:hypothetical protein